MQKLSGMQNLQTKYVSIWQSRIPVNAGVRNLLVHKIFYKSAMTIYSTWQPTANNLRPVLVRLGKHLDQMSEPAQFGISRWLQP